jgi:hypothetical protein
MTNFAKAVMATSCTCVVLLSGCASLPKMDLNDANRQKIHSIAMVHVNEPLGESVFNMGGAAGAFGLIGGLVQGAINVNHTKAYTQRVADAKIQFAPVMVDGLTQRLSSSGYQLLELKGQQPKLSADGKSDDYSSIQTDADAILNVWFTSFGYVSPPESSDFIPWIVVRTRLLDAKTKQDLYYKTFACGWDIKNNAVHVPSDGAFRYGSFDALSTQFDQSVAGIRSCEDAIVAMIGQDLYPAK